MSTRKETFHKSEKLCSTKIIGGLVENGDIFHTQLLKVMWRISPVTLPSPAQIAFSVSKRNFRLAVTRNLIKRRLREAYRKNKHILYDFLTGEKKQLVLILILRGTAIPEYSNVEKGIIEVMNRLISLLQATEKQKKS